MRSFLLISFFTFSCLFSISLGQACIESAIDPNLDQEVIERHIKNYNNNKKSTNDHIPVTIHVSESSLNGSDFSIESIRRDLLSLNAVFGLAGIEFYFCGSPRIMEGGSQAFTIQDASSLNQRLHVENTINVYIVDDIVGTAGTIGFAFYPWTRTPETRFVMVTPNDLPNDVSFKGLLAHELGHFYGLFHTHDVVIEPEFVDGSNCLRGGDMLCDTPADYNLINGGVNSSTCQYIGNFLDSKGDPYLPDPRNYMSYAYSTCFNKFTVNQAAKMNFYHSTELTYLTSECSFPDFLISSAEPTKSIRADQDINVTYALDREGDIDLNEIEVYFWLSDDQSELGTIIQKEIITLPPGSTTLDLDFSIDFPINRSTNTYYLTAQVDPEFKVLEQEEGNNLHTITVTVDNSSLEDQVVFANPVSNNILKIFLRDNSSKTELNFYIWDHLGRLHKTVNAFKNRDEYFEEIDISALADGIYILEAHFPDKGKSQSFNFYKQSF